MFWFTWKTLSGSYFALIDGEPRVVRAVASPARAPDPPSIMKFTYEPPIEYGCERVEVVDRPRADGVGVRRIGIDACDHGRPLGVAVGPRASRRQRPALPRPSDRVECASSTSTSAASCANSTCVSIAVVGDLRRRSRRASTTASPGGTEAVEGAVPAPAAASPCTPSSAGAAACAPAARAASAAPRSSPSSTR